MKHYFQDVLITKPFAVTVQSDMLRCGAHTGNTISSLNQLSIIYCSRLLPLLVNSKKAWMKQDTGHRVEKFGPEERKANKILRKG